MLRFFINFLMTSLIFFPEKTHFETPKDYGLLFEDVFFKTADGIKLHGWFLEAKPDPAGVLLFFHGNAGNISGRLFKAKGWIKRGYSVFLADYRGYGKSEGKIDHEEDVTKDAQAAWKWLREENKFTEEKIIIFGESLGSHPAIRLGGLYRPKAVLLEAPFTSFIDLAKLHYGAIPGIDFLMRDFQFQNINFISQINAPLFILHGTSDETCPFEMSEKLMAKAPEPKELFSISNGFHNDLPQKSGEAYWDKPVEFLQKTGSF
ncbi:MAG: alpha/beta fold hydrolase [Candidatus Omnitrophica bacterium]|nr:alpha/beta fold hydrolase [Candidatus Omnitrophota bacterium]